MQKPSDGSSPLSASPATAAAGPTQPNLRKVHQTEGERLLRYAWTAIPLFLVVVPILWMLDLQWVAEPPYLLPILNFIFRTAVATAVAVLAARSFSRNGSLPILLLGCGMLAFGAVSAISGIAIHYQELNVAVTTYAMGALAAGAFHLLSAAAALSTGTWAIRQARLVLLCAYGLVLLSVGMMANFALIGLMPDFFVPGEGPTPFRNLVLALAIAMFAGATLMVGFIARRRNWTFGRWYALALALICIGYLAMLFNTQVGSSLSWAARSAQYLGGIYLLVAVANAARKDGEWDAPLQAALRESEQQLRALFDNMSEGFIVGEPVLREDGTPADIRLLMINDALEKHSGLTRQMIGAPLREHLPAFRHGWIDACCRVATTGRQDYFEEFDPESARHYKVVCYSPSEGRFAALITDVTERKEAEQALTHARDELEQRVLERTRELQQRADQLARLTSELTLTEQRERKRLAQILHDHLQQLLVGAKLSLDLLQRKLPLVDRNRAERIDHLLTESIETARSLTVELSPPILHEAGLTAGLEWLARWMKEKQNFSVELRIKEKLVVEREDVRLLVFQAVRELLFNASKHANVADAAVEISRHGAEQLKVVVEDRGCGFEPHAAFEYSRSLTGGFGLFSIQERLDLLGGRLVVESEPGHGSRFTVIAPINGSHRKQTHPRRLPSAPSSQPRFRIAPSAEDKIRILIVDDHDVVRHGFSSLLACEEDLTVVGEADDGCSAVRLAQELQPDIVLMDFSMPHMDGVEATRAIRREFPQIQIIGLSMYEEADRARAMLDAGAVAYLAKSEKPATLLEAIRRCAQAPPVTEPALS